MTNRASEAWDAFPYTLERRFASKVCGIKGGFSMEATRVSLTAVMNTYVRAFHALHDTPVIFDDFLAKPFLTEEEYGFLGKGMAQSLAFFNPELAAQCQDEVSAAGWAIRTQSGPIILGRARYTEESLAAAVGQGVEQYVILGAGIDTFAFRQKELVKQLQVFEVDHPVTQAFKRQRLADLEWDIPAQLHFIPIDFTKQDLATALGRSQYDPRKLTFFSWLGVTYYLTRELVLAMLGSLARIAPAGSIIVFDYMDADAFVPERASIAVQRMHAIVKQVGEPMQTGFDPKTLAGELAGAGWHLKENLAPADIETRYFQGRTDGFHAFQHVHFAKAVVSG
jgi:methyltransferase (TIGR00027 family)